MQQEADSRRKDNEIATLREQLTQEKRRREEAERTATDNLEKKSKSNAGEKGRRMKEGERARKPKEEKKKEYKPPVPAHPATITHTPPKCTYCHKIFKHQQGVSDHERVCIHRPSQPQLNTPPTPQQKKRGNTHTHAGEREEEREEEEKKEEEKEEEEKTEEEKKEEEKEEEEKKEEEKKEEEKKEEEKEEEEKTEEEKTEEEKKEEEKKEEEKKEEEKTEEEKKEEEKTEEEKKEEEKTEEEKTEEEKKEEEKTEEEKKEEEKKEEEKTEEEKTEEETEEERQRMEIYLKQGKEKEQQNAAEKGERLAKERHAAEARQKQKPKAKAYQSSFSKKRFPTKQSCKKELGGAKKKDRKAVQPVTPAPQSSTGGEKSSTAEQKQRNSEQAIETTVRQQLHEMGLAHHEEYFTLIKTADPLLVPRLLHNTPLFYTTLLQILYMYLANPLIRTFVSVSSCLSDITKVCVRILSLSSQFTPEDARSSYGWLTFILRHLNTPHATANSLALFYCACAALSLYKVCDASHSSSENTLPDSTEHCQAALQYLHDAQAHLSLHDINTLIDSIPNATNNNELLKRLTLLRTRMQAPEDTRKREGVEVEAEEVKREMEEEKKKKKEEKRAEMERLKKEGGIDASLHSHTPPPPQSASGAITSLDSVSFSAGDGIMREGNTLIHAGPTSYLNCFIGGVMTSV